ncbi:polysaccharide deacetylase [Vulcanibacillus modesticaldus]|uniref:Polysaccharide deacetylase n=1 Tax=Vulcanibacillus modesticaldus TaxID=337097 RepID=A0A1D2YVE5_9BACI|nr:polysaccharide deacetylase [Vulcanibacillus modesticaldus]
MSNAYQLIPKSREKKIILTFDDGPSRNLDKILDILKIEKIQAMFFWQARLLHSKRSWKRVLDEGHIIATHSFKHPNLTKLSYQEQFREIKKSIQKIEEITGKPVVYFRPPFGQYNQETLLAAKQLNLTTVMWSLASLDWKLKNSPETIVKNVVTNLEDGAIILLHELEQTSNILMELIRSIKTQGYAFGVLPNSAKK